MNRMQRNIGIFSGGCAQFLWVYGLIRLLTYAATGKGSPVLVCFVVFWAVVALTAVIRRSRLYVIVILLLYGALFYLSAQWLFFSQFHGIGGDWADSSSGPFFWMMLLQRASTVGEWLSILAVSFSLILLWVSGIHFTMRRMSYEGSLRILETGAVSFLAVGLLQIPLGQAPGANLYLLLFFLWTILSIMLHRTPFRSSEKNSGVKLFRWFFLFALSMFLMVITVMTFFTDTLRWLAEAGISATKAVAEPFLPYLVAFLRLLFGRKNIRNESSSSGGLGESSESAVGSLGEPGLFYVIMEKLFVGIMVLLFLVVVVSVVRMVWKFLFSKRGGASGGNSLGDLLRAGIQALAAFFIYLYRNLKSLAHLWGRDEKAMEKVYRRLLRWGTIRGVYHEVYETPLEYAQKLAAKYEKHEDVFLQIVKSYYREIYGEKSLDRDEVALVRKSLRGLS